MKAKVIVPIIVAIIGIIGGGAAYSFDFSSTTTGDTDNSQTTIINEGDTIINEAVDVVVDDIFDDLIDRGYDFYCEEVEPDSEECDVYWDDD